MPRYDPYDRYDDDDDDDFDDIRVGRRRNRYRARSGSKPQSGLGITSVCLAGVVFFGYLATFALAIAFEVNNNAPRRDDDPLENLLVLGLIGSGCLNLAGVVLGFVGCFQTDRSIIWAILGAVFNTILLFGVIALVCAGLLMG